MSDDYRASHQQSGAHYDATILGSPFDAYMDLWEAHYLGDVLARLFKEPIPRYLDFACGTGRITARVAPHAAEACGVDISESMLNVARGKCPGVRFVCVDLTRSDAEPGPYDLITSFRFLGNAQDELREAALAAIARRLRPGGYLVVNNHRNPRSLVSLAQRMAGSREALDLDLNHAKLRRMLRRHGLEIVHRRAIGFWIFRSRLMSAKVLDSAPAGWLEHAFRHGLFAPFAPDALVVARRTQGHA